MAKQMNVSYMTLWRVLRGESRGNIRFWDNVDTYRENQIETKVDKYREEVTANIGL